MFGVGSRRLRVHGGRRVASALGIPLTVLAATTHPLADFGKFALCEGQNQVDPLGYAALSINLVRAGLGQPARIPGTNIGNLNINTCDDPTFSTDGTNTLAANDPFPPAGDRQGATRAPRWPRASH